MQPAEILPASANDELAFRKLFEHPLASLRSHALGALASDNLLEILQSLRQKTAVQIDGKDLYLAPNAYVYGEPRSPAR